MCRRACLHVVRALACATCMMCSGETHALEQPGDLLDGSLGLLGVVTEVTLYVAPKKKMAVRELQVRLAGVSGVWGGAGAHW
jgi:hypothetical protein